MESMTKTKNELNGERALNIYTLLFLAAGLIVGAALLAARAYLYNVETLEHFGLLLIGAGVGAAVAMKIAGRLRL